MIVTKHEKPKKREPTRQELLDHISFLKSLRAADDNIDDEAIRLAFIKLLRHDYFKGKISQQEFETRIDIIMRGKVDAILKDWEWTSAPIYRTDSRSRSFRWGSLIPHPGSAFIAMHVAVWSVMLAVMIALTGPFIGVISSGIGFARVYTGRRRRW